MNCINCRRDLHGLCEECQCCNPASKNNNAARSGVYGASGHAGHSQNEGEIYPEKFSEKGEVYRAGERDKPGNIRSYKSDELVTDPQSTGRKRAAVLFPLDREAKCEWQGLTNCGGGKYPIVGCIEGKQEHRHHGPDKNTLNNSVGNVHRICDNCHNVWHSQNDPNYDPQNPGKHEPREATPTELVKRFGGLYKSEPAST